MEVHDEIPDMLTTNHNEKLISMAERIKERRIIMGYTQEKLAKKLNLQKSAIAKYENGRVKNIKCSIIEEMAKILDCSPSYLMGWDEYGLVNQPENFKFNVLEKSIIVKYRKADNITQAMVLRVLSIEP